VEAVSRALEHGTSRSGRWLRLRRLPLALWIAVAEGILLIAGAVPRAPALALAAVLIAAHLFVGRRASSYALRQASWIAATSQALVLLIPVLLLLVLGAVALSVVAILALLALVVLLASRR
jgi:uncharacterized membrane protein YphA (DoxX/SURF4 family)